MINAKKTQSRKEETTQILREVENTPTFIEDFNERFNLSEGKGAIKLDSLYAFVIEGNYSIFEESPLFIKRMIEDINHKIEIQTPLYNLRDVKNAENMKGEIVISVDTNEIIENIYAELKQIVESE